MNSQQRRTKRRAKIYAQKKRLSILRKSLHPYQIEAMERLTNLPHRGLSDMFQWGRGYSSLRMRIPNLDNLPKLIVKPLPYDIVPKEQSIGRVMRGLVKEHPEIWMIESGREGGEITMKVLKERVNGDSRFTFDPNFKIGDEIFKPEGEEDGS